MTPTTNVVDHIHIAVTANVFRNVVLVRCAILTKTVIHPIHVAVITDVVPIALVQCVLPTRTVTDPTHIAVIIYVFQLALAHCAIPMRNVADRIHLVVVADVVRLAQIHRRRIFSSDSGGALRFFCWEILLPKFFFNFRLIIIGLAVCNIFLR